MVSGKIFSVLVFIMYDLRGFTQCCFDVVFLTLLRNLGSSTVQ